MKMKREKIDVERKKNLSEHEKKKEFKKLPRSKKEEAKTYMRKENT